jgi:protein-L-isoaspartate(D-aspartate) O-methyltransferase
MVDQLASSFNEAPITDKRVLDALRRVPRHEFVPESVRSQSYQNRPLPIGESQTISQPYIVALMTQLLELDGTENVLEIGTGSGYQAAILGELAAEVTTVEIRPPLLEEAKKKLEDLKARGVLGWKKLVAVVGDGSRGYPPGAPYDAIIVTAAPSKVPDALLEQLRPGGRLVIPVGDFFQELRLIQKDAGGGVTEKTIVPVRFVPLLEDEK